MHLATRHPQLQFNDIGVDFFFRLRTASSVSVDEFKQLYLPPLERLALLIQDCPLEPSAFAEVGGALKFALTSAFSGLSLCDGVIFDPSASSRVRAEIEPQFRFAAFCATLAAVPILVHHHVQIHVGDHEWSIPSGEYLYTKALTTGYDVAWKPVTPQRPSSSLAAVLLAQLFPAGTFANLKPEVVLSLCEAINPACIQNRTENSLGKIVRLAQEKTRAAEIERVSRVFGLSQATLPIVSADQGAAQDSEAPSGGGTAQIWAVSQAARLHLAVGAVMSNDIQSWVKAVSKACPTEISLLAEDKVKVTRKALNFGISAKEMYQKIYSEGLVDERVDDGFIGTAVLRAEFNKHMGVLK
jgi:conjugal transfer pilus assembly protein TraI